MPLSSPTKSRIVAGFLVYVLCLLAPGSARGQIVDPTTAEFTPSADHNVITDGVPVVSSYDLGFYLPGAPQPFQSMSLGKPTIAGDGMVRVVFTGLMGAVPTPGILYEARVSAVGPGGVSTSAPSNQFMFSAPPTCTFGVSPATQSIAAGGGTGNAAVTAGPLCVWNATSNASWITITAGSSGTGNGNVSYSVAANTSSSPRSGTLTVAGQPVTVNQSGAPCNYTVSGPSSSLPAGAGSSSASVTAPSGCTWNATSNASWITITSGTPGSGNGVVNFSVTANTSTSLRSGTLTVAGQTVTINQNGTTCTYTVSGPSSSLPAGAGSSSVSVTTIAGCTWNATSNAAWITITSGTSGSGNGVVNFSVTANTSTSPRSGTLTVAGQPVTVNQSGTCSFTASPTSHSLAAAGGTRSVSVTTTSGCAWTATDNRSWISITAGSSGTGNGTVTFSVTANTGTASRSGAVTVGGQTVSVDQSGTCNFTVTPTSQTIDVSGGTSSVSVTTTTGCAWTATSSASWITVTAGSTGSGSGTVNYSVAANTGSARNGTLTVAGRAVTVSQPANDVPAAPNNLRVVTNPGD